MSITAHRRAWLANRSRYSVHTRPCCGGTHQCGRGLLLRAQLLPSYEAIVHQLTALAAGVNPRHQARDLAATNRLRTEATDHLLSAGRAVGVQSLRCSELRSRDIRTHRQHGEDRGRPARSHPPESMRGALDAIRYRRRLLQAPNGRKESCFVMAPSTVPARGSWSVEREGQTRARLASALAKLAPRICERDGVFIIAGPGLGRLMGELYEELRPKALGSPTGCSAAWARPRM
jgi:hypothetical protein